MIAPWGKNLPKDYLNKKAYFCLCIQQVLISLNKEGETLRSSEFVLIIKLLDLLHISWMNKIRMFNV